MTGYRELRDWAKNMLQIYEYLIAVLISISTVGASLVYATIFSASRGKIGFMCLTFPLFTVGFLVPVTAPIFLKWAASLPNPVPFASQKFWKHVINVLMAFAVISVLTALAVLNVTIFFLDSDSSPSLDASVQDPTDSVSRGLVSISGIAVYAFSGSIFLILFGAIILAILATRRDSGRRLWSAAFPPRTSNALEGFKHI